MFCANFISHYLLRSLFILSCSFLVVFFFFKQKTAYEMRISDWSSDVCSSDLPRLHRGGDDREEKQRLRRRRGRILCGAGDRDQRIDRREAEKEIGRASCRERVCQYV